jgi:flagellar biosynthesis GTPase FlhF
MELKRILARDTRAANEKAVALYGPDVLVISSSKVRGQTELIVAVDVAPLDAETAIAETFVPTEKTYVLSDKPVPDESPASFGQVLDDTMGRQKRQGKPAKASSSDGFVPAAQLKTQVAKEATVETSHVAATDKVAAVAAIPTPALAVDTVAAEKLLAAQEERDKMRSREIVDMVREEQRRRSTGEEALLDVTDGIARVFAAERGTGSNRPPRDTAVVAEHPLLSELEALCVESGFGNLRNLDDADLVSCRTVLAEFESRMSIERKQLFTRIDELSDELVQRYRTSSSDVDSLLDEGR